MSLKLWFTGEAPEVHGATGLELRPGVNEFDTAQAIELKRVLGDRVRLATPFEVERARIASLEAERRSNAAAERQAQEHLAAEVAGDVELATAREEAAFELGIVDERDEAVEVPVAVAAVEGEE